MAKSANKAAGTRGVSVQSFATRVQQQSIQRNNVPARKLGTRSSVKQFQERMKSRGAGRDEFGFPRSEQLAYAKKEMAHSTNSEHTAETATKKQTKSQSQEQQRSQAASVSRFRAAQGRSQAQSEQMTQARSQGMAR